MSVMILSQEELSRIALVLCAKGWNLGDAVSPLADLAYANAMAFVDRYAHRPECINDTEPLTEADIREAIATAVPELRQYVTPGAVCALSESRFRQLCANHADMAKAREAMAMLLYNSDPEAPGPYLSPTQVAETLEITRSLLLDL